MANRKDTEYLYSSTRVRALERTLLTRDRCERMIDAASEEDVRRLLQDCGYAPGDLSSSDGIERMLRARRDETAALLRSIAPDTALVEEQQIPLDYHNLKVFLKAQARGEAAPQLYSTAGRVPPEKLETALQQGRLQDLPADLAAAYGEAARLLHETGDPQRMDFYLDKACQAARAQVAERSGSDYLKKLTALRADAANLRILVRAARLGKEPSFVQEALLSGGSVSQQRLLSAYVTELAAAFSGTPFAAAAELGDAAKKPGVPLTAFERAVDNALTGFLRSARTVTFGPAPLIAYLTAREDELKSVRTILTGRLYGVDPAVIRERLRDAYVQ